MFQAIFRFGGFKWQRRLLATTTTGPRSRRFVPPLRSCAELRFSSPASYFSGECKAVLLLLTQVLGALTPASLQSSVIGDAGEHVRRKVLRRNAEIDLVSGLFIASDQLESCRVATFPIFSLLVQGLQTYIIARPVILHTMVSLVNLLE